MDYFDDENKMINSPDADLIEFQKQFMIEMKKNNQIMKKIELDFEQEISKMRVMKDIEIARIRAPIFQEAIKSEAQARRYWNQTIAEKIFDDPSLLSVVYNRNKLSVIRNEDNFSITCPTCNREVFEVPKQPGNYRYKCNNKFMLFETPWVHIDVGYNGSISVKGK